MVNGVHKSTFIITWGEGRQRALSNREPFYRGNRTVHGFHGSKAHGSTVEP